MPPDALSLPRTELPEEIATAIEELLIRQSECHGSGRVSLRDARDEARSTLTAAILSRLREAEAQGAPSGTGYSRAEPSGLGPEAEYPSRGWQPIATAPKDGRWVLLSGGRIEYGWDRETKPPAVVGQAVNGGEDGWQFAWYDSGYYGEYEDPTHWMPLPAPPALSEAPSQGDQ